MQFLRVVKRDEVQDEKMRKIHKIRSFWLFPYRKNKYFHEHGQKRPVAYLSAVDFRHQLRKHTITQVKYVTFNFSSRI